MSDTAPRNQNVLQFNAPRPRPRERNTGQHLWAVNKGASCYAAELRDNGAVGVEIQLWRDGELRYGQRYPTRDEAMKRAAIFRRDLEQRGWR